MPFEDSKKTPRRETELEQARRHLHEAGDRLARQKQIVRKMARYGGSQDIQSGPDLLNLMELVVDLARRRLSRLEGTEGPSFDRKAKETKRNEVDRSDFSRQD